MNLKKIFDSIPEDEQVEESMPQQHKEILNEYFFDLCIKFLYFLNQKELSESTSVDKMDWDNTVKEFRVYLKNQEPSLI